MIMITCSSQEVHGLVRRTLLAAVCLAALVLLGCSTTYTLKMKPELDLDDGTVVSHHIKNKEYNRIMVLPPSGTKRGQYDPEVALFEREFLKNDITVISGAITGRVVFEESKDEKKRVEGATPLSDAERALIMAKKTGADAILQIGSIQWIESNGVGRHFILNPEDEKLEYLEVPLKQFRNWDNVKIKFPSQWLHFVGRLTDVETGEVIASFKLSSAANWNLPSSYRATYELDGKDSVLVTENFDYKGGQWLQEAKDATVSRVIGQVARRITGR